MGIFYKLLSIFFGPNDRATARHLAETAKRQDPFGEFMHQWDEKAAKPLPSIKVDKSKLALLQEHEVSTKLPIPVPAPDQSKKQAILSFIKSHSPAGITAEKVGKAFPAWRYSTITARISELYKAGIIVSVGTANTAGGSLASLFAVAKNG
jgi:hypothetical protein